MVEETLPAEAPDGAAACSASTPTGTSRRGTSFSTLYPRLAPGGVLIIDDYGHYEGVKRAVDEYFDERRQPLLLNRIDYTGRLAVKQERA